MKNHYAALTWLGLGLLTLTAGVTFIIPHDLSAPSSMAVEPLPNEITLTGILRDFDTKHGDFDVVPTKGLGHYAGTVQTTLGPDDLPEFDLDAGYKVATQWTNADGIPIAPHLFQTSGVVVNGPAFFVDGDVSLRSSASIEALSGDALLVTNSTSTGAVTLLSSSEINGNVYIGPGGDPSDVVQGDGISGEIVVLDEPFELPVVEEPADMGPSQGDKTYSGDTISGKLHAGKLTVKGNVLIVGETTILCDELAMKNSGEFTLAPNATLELYVRDAISLSNSSAINKASGNPSRVTMYYLGSGDIKVSNSHRMYASVIAPQGHFFIKQSAQLTGSLIVARLTLEQSAELHMMEGGSVGATDACGVYDDTPGTAGVTNNGAISSAESFKQWFNDDLDANLSVTYPITLTNDSSGESLVFGDKAFYPLDDQGKGNEGDAHNSHFTYTIAAKFQHDACAGKYVQFDGGDGAWIFIDGRLAIDLGGVQTGQSQRFDLDRFGLTDGETYEFHLFYANRNADGSTIGFRTNLLLWQDPVLATATNPFD